MNLKFHKMEGAGNDFVVLNNRDYGFSLDEIIAFTPKLCDRKFGIGADGILVLEKPTLPDTDFTMIYRNSDGSDAGMCGNGARCITMFAAHFGFDETQTFNVHSAIYKAEVNKADQSSTIYFPDVLAPSWIEVGGTKLLQVYTGTEHVVCFADRAKLDDEEELVSMGRSIREHESLNPPGTNVNFVSVKNEMSIDLQTYERGVEDLTLACGTGALASAISSHFLMDGSPDIHRIDVQVKGGLLGVTFLYDENSKTYKNLALSGPAKFVYEGSIEL